MPAGDATVHVTNAAYAETLRIVALTTNSISIAMSLAVVVTYVFLWRLFPRLLTRTSLKLSTTVALADMAFSISNLAGYGPLPEGFVCAFVGGMLFASTSLLSMFYTCAIALNCQLVLVYDRPPKAHQQSWFLTAPLAAVVLITFPSLAAGMYGYDEAFDYCWYATEGLNARTLVLRTLFSYDIWLFLAVPYLMFASWTITRKVFSKNNRINQLASPKSTIHGVGYLGPGAGTSSVLEQDEQMRAVEDSEHVRVLRRRNNARKALTLRLLGGVLVPIFCLIPGIILDLITKSGGRVPPAVNIGFIAVQGLLGTLNALLFVRDPTIVAISQNMEAANPPTQTATMMSTTSYHNKNAIKRDKNGYPLPMNLSPNDGGSFLPMSELGSSGAVVSEGDGSDAIAPGRSGSRLGGKKPAFAKWKPMGVQQSQSGGGMIMVSVEVSRHTDAVNVLNNVGDDLNGL